MKTTHARRLSRFWATLGNPPAFSPLGLGCGLTAFGPDDARTLINDSILSKYPEVELVELAEDVDVSKLDAHVLPNIGDVTARGIWFPLGSPAATPNSPSRGRVKIPQLSARDGWMVTRSPDGSQRERRLL
jgi:hypothetical protein